MDTLSFVVRYGFVLALVIEAAILGRAFLAMLLQKAKAPVPVPVETPAAQE